MEKASPEILLSKIFDSDYRKVSPTLVSFLSPDTKSSLVLYYRQSSPDREAPIQYSPYQNSESQALTLDQVEKLGKVNNLYFDIKQIPSTEVDHISQKYLESFKNLDITTPKGLKEFSRLLPNYVDDSITLPAIFSSPSFKDTILNITEKFSQLRVDSASEQLIQLDPVTLAHSLGTTFITFNFRNFLDSPQLYKKRNIPDELAQSLLVELPPQQLIFSCLYHDLGKYNIDPDILHKPGKLDPDEWETMKTHVQFSYDFFQNVVKDNPSFPFQTGLLSILQHHEDDLGTGYPNALKKEQLPLLSRLLHITDIYHALTSKRPYKEAYTPQKAISILKEDAQKGKIDSALLNIFICSLEFPNK